MASAMGLYIEKRMLEKRPSGARLLSCACTLQAETHGTTSDPLGNRQTDSRKTVEVLIFWGRSDLPYLIRSSVYPVQTPDFEFKTALRFVMPVRSAGPLMS